MSKRKRRDNELITLGRVLLDILQADVLCDDCKRFFRGWDTENGLTEQATGMKLRTDFSRWYENACNGGRE